jgi:Rod binding domain-containing protein
MTGLPPIDQSLIPADVRNGSSQDKKTYQAALGFEQTLVNELTKAMSDTAQPDGSGGDDMTSTDDSTDAGEAADDSQDAATSMYMQMLPDQLSTAITQAGGLGLARSFYDSMKESGK